MPYLKVEDMVVVIKIKVDLMDLAVVPADKEVLVKEELQVLHPLLLL